MRPERRKDISHWVTGLGVVSKSTLGMLAIATILASTALPAATQDRAEISGFIGYTSSEGVSVDRSDVGSEFIDRVNLKNGVAFGAAVNFLVEPKCSARRTVRVAGQRHGAGGFVEPRTDQHD